MATTYTLISAYTLSSTTSTVTFSAIPQTFDNLVLRSSLRSATAGVDVVVNVRLNGSSSTYTYRYWAFTGANSDGGTLQRNMMATGSTQGSGFFSVGEIFIPNYTKTIARTIGGISALENTGTYRSFGTATYWDSTAPITSIEINETGGFVAGSTLRLYGIKNT
jgi:hypothetical protein